MPPQPISLTPAEIRRDNLRRYLALARRIHNRLMAEHGRMGALESAVDNSIESPETVEIEPRC